MIHRNLICTISDSNVGMAEYLVDALKQKFEPDYNFTIIILGEDCEVWVETGLSHLIGR